MMISKRGFEKRRFRGVRFKKVRGVHNYSKVAPLGLGKGTQLRP